jgi:hypothetical protein
MRLVAVSVVKNEADIIEAFVRHTLAWVDHHLIFDHASTDGTREILGALQAENLPLTLFCDDALANLQQARSNHLTRHAARHQRADWVLPLDADEILCSPGSSRMALENALRESGITQPASLPLLNYCLTDVDDPAESNPVLRLRYRQPSISNTRKIFIPSGLALDPGIVAGKGSHALYRGNEILPSRALPEGVYLAHLALRSRQHQVLRVILAELQKISRGRSAEGLDVHYRLGYQLLAEDPELFFATLCPPLTHLQLQPIDYRGGLLRHSASQDWSRVARALLPYLEKLAASHGRLTDAASIDALGQFPTELNIRELSPGSIPTKSSGAAARGFSGFTPIEGWGPREGPVPEAFLPAFHWAYAPITRLAIDSPSSRSDTLCADLLTYCENQSITIKLNGSACLTHAFTCTNQRERLTVPLFLRPGRNELTLHYERSLVTDYDPRKLAALFLGLTVIGLDAPDV